jgi:hypothetical protein
MVFKSVEDLVDGRTDCGEAARDGCLVVGNLASNIQLYLRKGRESLDQVLHFAALVTLPCHTFGIPPVTNKEQCKILSFKTLYPPAA